LFTVWVVSVPIVAAFTDTGDSYIGVLGGVLTLLARFRSIV